MRLPFHCFIQSEFKKNSGIYLGNIDKTIQPLLTGRLEKNIVSIVLQKMRGNALQAAVTMLYSEIQQAADFHIQAVSSAMLMEGYPDLVKNKLHFMLEAQDLPPGCGCGSGCEQKERIKGKQRLKQ